MTNVSESSESRVPILRHAPRERDFEVAFADPETVARIEAHIQAHIGAPATVFHELVSDLVHIDVHIVEPTPARNFFTLITSGMSDLPMQTPPGCEELRYAELLLCLPPSWPLTNETMQDENNYWPIRWLKKLARLPHEYQTWLCPGHTVPNGDPPVPFAANTQLCCMLLSVPVLFSSEVLNLRINDQKTIKFYSVLPIYQEEIELKMQRGAEYLLFQLAENGVTELLDINRQSISNIGNTGKSSQIRKKRFGIF